MTQKSDFYKKKYVGVVLPIFSFLLIYGLFFLFSFLIMLLDTKMPVSYFDRATQTPLFKFLYYFQIFYIRFFGVLQLVYMIPLIYFFKKKGNVLFVRDVLIGTLLIFLLNIVFVFFGFLDTYSRKDHLVNRIKSDDNKIMVLEYEDDYQKKTFFAKVGLIKYPPSVLSYKIEISGLSGGDINNLSFEELSSRLEDHIVFKADSVKPFSGPEIKWKNSRTLLISYEDARVLKYEKELKSSDGIVDVLLVQKNK